MLDWEDPLAVFSQPETNQATVGNQVQRQQVNDAVIGAALLEAEKTEAKKASEAALSAKTSTKIVKPQQQQLPAEALLPVRAEDKRVITGSADINQLAPFKYPWAWDYFLNANKNHWTPLDISMAADVHDYHHKLTVEEKHVYENVLSYLTTSDILAMRNIGLAVMEKMRAPELQIYQARQVYEEALHTWTYQHCIESLGLDQGEIYNRYRVVPQINAKIQMANRRIECMLRPNIDLENKDEQHKFVMLVLQRFHPNLRLTTSWINERHRRTTAIHHAR